MFSSVHIQGMICSEWLFHSQES